MCYHGTVMVKRYTCERCGKGFRTVSGANWHVDRAHGKDGASVAKGPGRLSLQEQLVIQIATELHVFDKVPELRKMAQNRLRESLHEVTTRRI